MRIGGATEETFPFAKEFLLYYLPGGNIFLTMCFNFNSMMRASGYPAKAMYTMLIGGCRQYYHCSCFYIRIGMGNQGSGYCNDYIHVHWFVFCNVPFYEPEQHAEIA